MWAVITLRSLIWARTYMRMYTNSVGQTSVCAVGTGHVQIVCGKFVYTNRSLRHAQIACLITTWLYRNIVKTSAQSDQKMSFWKITPHSRVCKSTFCSSHAFWSTHTLFSMRDHIAGNRIIEGASPKTRMRSLISKYILERQQSDYLTFHQCSGISAALHREKNYRLPCAYNNYKIRLHS